MSEDASAAPTFPQWLGYVAQQPFGSGKWGFFLVFLTIPFTLFAACCSCIAIGALCPPWRGEQWRRPTDGDRHLLTGLLPRPYTALCTLPPCRCHPQAPTTTVFSSLSTLCSALCSSIRKHYSS